MIVLDTHAWLWWLDDPDRLSARARAVVEETDVLGIATISAWELTMLSLRGRVTLDRPPRNWIRDALAQPRMRELPLTAEIAVTAALLENEGFHPDPADRIIYASACEAGARLVSRDARLAKRDPARVLW